MQVSTEIITNELVNYCQNKSLSIMIRPYQGQYILSVQFWEENVGIQQKIIKYFNKIDDFHSILITTKLFKNVVGYNEDFTFHNGLTSNSKQFDDLQRLLGREIIYLPDFNKLIDALFEIICDGLKLKYRHILEEIGKILKWLPNKSELAILFNKCKNNNNIFWTEYAASIVDNYQLLLVDLEELFYVPDVVTEFYRNTTGYFFLIFLVEIYKIFDNIKPTKNSAVLYYLQLKKLSRKFRYYENHGIIPEKANQVFIDLDNNDLIGKVIHFYGRARIVIDTALEQYHYLDEFSWISLDETDFKDNIHGTYHTFTKHQKCNESCQELRNEIEIIQPFLERGLKNYNGPIDELWQLTLNLIQCEQNGGKLEIVKKLLEFVFSLPATFDGVLDGN